MNLLSLDFDGVVHPANDSIMINFREGMAPWQIEIALKAQKRFIWAHQLEAILQGSDISLVIHSTWRKRFSDATMKHFLPPSIAGQLLILDGQIANRETATADDYLADILDLVQPNDVCVLDDRPGFFSGGRVQQWMNNASGRFIWTEPDVGLQSHYACGQLTAWCQSGHNNAPASASEPAPK